VHFAALDEAHAFAEYLAFRAVTPGLDKLGEVALKLLTKVGNDHQDSPFTGSILNFLMTIIRFLGRSAPAVKPGQLFRRKIPSIRRVWLTGQTAA
jgi:hypothetical protein